MGNDISKSQEFSELLDLFESLPVTTSSTTIFNIAGYPHYENVCSNILAFYLDPNNEHGMGSLFLSSLMSFVDGCDGDYGNEVKVDREVSTAKGRLDIVVLTAGQIIGIENKLYHHLNNDLNDYGSFLDATAKEQGDKDSIKLVLSLRQEQMTAGFVCITYEELWEKIRENLGKYVSTSSQKWMLYLVDFMEAIEKLYEGNMELDESDSFFIENNEKLAELIEARKIFQNKLKDRLKTLFSLVEKPDESPRPEIYSNCIYTDFPLSKGTIVLDVKIHAEGWELSFIGRNVKNRLFLRSLFSTSELERFAVVPKKDRYIVSNEMPITTEPEVIKVEMEKWTKSLFLADEELKRGDKNLDRSAA